jgi:hypothetical protein
MVKVITLWRGCGAGEGMRKKAGSRKTHEVGRTAVLFGRPPARREREALPITATFPARRHGPDRPAGGDSQGPSKASGERTPREHGAAGEPAVHARAHGHFLIVHAGADDLSFRWSEVTEKSLDDEKNLSLHPK